MTSSSSRRRCSSCTASVTPTCELPTPCNALAAIEKHGFLEDWQARNLADAYRFLRVVEHRLQMMHQIKTHTVPESPREIALLARRVSAGPLGRVYHR